MKTKKTSWFIGMIAILTFSSGCGVYSFTGGQFGEAKTFSVEYLKPRTALASPVYAQRITESLKDVLLSQSPLKLTESSGDLRFRGNIIQYGTAPVAVQAGVETASLNRLTIAVQIYYENRLNPSLNFEKTFSKFADFEANQDLFTIEESLWKLINDQLVQEIYNSSVGNW